MPSAASARISPQKSRRACGSKPVVGSSRKSSSGRPTMPSATSSRRRCPPLRPTILVSACVVEADRGEHVGDVARVRVGLRGAGERLARGQQVQAPGRLQHDADPVAPLEAGPLRVGAEDAHVAGVARPEPLGDLDGGRLAGAVRAEQREALAGADVEVEPVDGGPPRVGLGESPDGDRVCHASSVLPVDPGRDARAVDRTSTDRWTLGIQRSQEHFVESGAGTALTLREPPDPAKCS